MTTAHQKSIRNPMKKGRSRKTISANIRREMHRGHPQKQAVAMAMRAAGISRKGNPSRGTLDSNAARELVLYAENIGPGTGGFVYNQRVSIIKNLRRKVAKGTYDHALAAKLWRYWMDTAAKEYTREFGTGTGYGIFSVPTREAAARQVADDMREEVMAQENPRKRRRSAAALRAERDRLEKRLNATPTNVDASKIIRRLGDLNVAIADAERPKNPRRKKRAVNPRKAAPRVYVVFKAKGHDVRFLTMRGPQVGWTLTRGDTVQWQDKKRAFRVAQYLSRKGSPDWRFGVSRRDAHIDSIVGAIAGKV